MNLIGLTGGISSGKSTVSKILKEKGFRILDLDQISKDIMKPDTPTYLKVKQTFKNEDIFDKDGIIDRRKLGDLIFNNESARSILNRITHTPIKKSVLNQIFLEFIKGTTTLILDSPLLFESGTSKSMHKIIVVDLNPKIQLERLIKRDKCPKENALNRIKAQMPLEEKKRKADFIIDNNGDLKNLEKEVELVLEKITPSKVFVVAGLGGRIIGVSILIFLLVWTFNFLFSFIF